MPDRTTFLRTRNICPLGFAVALLFLACSGGGNDASHAPTTMVLTDFTPANPRMTQQPLLDDLQYISSPSFEGRLVGSVGNATARTYIVNRFQTLGLAYYESGYAQAFTGNDGAYGTNVVGYLTGGTYPSSAILVSAHYDHIGYRNGIVCPGADDNASGIAAVLQLAAYFQAHPPAHTLIFVLFDGEESGLWGSEAFSSNPPAPISLSNIELVFNLDMIAQGTQGRIFVGGTGLGTYPANTNDFLRNTVVQGFAETKIQAVTDYEGYDANSDQYPFYQRGVPFLFFCVMKDDPYYHTPNDTYESIPKIFYWATLEACLDTLLRLDATASLPTVIARPVAHEIKPFSVKWNPHPWRNSEAR